MEEREGRTANGLAKTKMRERAVGAGGNKGGREKSQVRMTSDETRKRLRGQSTGAFKIHFGWLTSFQFRNLNLNFEGLSPLTIIVLARAAWRVTT